MWSPHQNNKGRKIKMKVKDILKAQKQYERLQEEVEHIKKFKEDLSLMRPKDSFNDDGFYGLICDIEDIQSACCGHGDKNRTIRKEIDYDRTISINTK